MPFVTVFGGKTFEVEKGKKLVLALEENGIEILSLKISGRKTPQMYYKNCSKQK